MARPQQQQQQQQGSPSKARRPAKRGGKEAPPTPLQALAALDARLSNVLYRRGTSVPRLVWRAFELSGDGLVWLAWASGMAAAPGTPPPTRAVWLNFLLAWAVDLILVGVGFRLAYRVGGLKAALRRPRPVYNAEAGDFTVIVAVDHHSFPSGHSSRASFVALFAALFWARSRPWLCGGVAAWALALALSRAAMGRHYLSDVMAGLLLGFATIGIVTRGQYTAGGLALSVAQSEAVYAFAKRLLGWLQAGAAGVLA